MPNTFVSVICSQVKNVGYISITQKKDSGGIRSTFLQLTDMINEKEDVVGDDDIKEFKKTMVREEDMLD